MENFNTLKINDRLNREEVEEVIELSKDEEKIKILLETNQFFNDFIESEYKLANENYLGEGGKTVKDLQVTLGFSGNDVTGVFSKQTFFALIKYQKENNLVVDGLAGEKTQAVMYGNKELTNSKIKEYFKIKENDLHLGSKGLNSMFLSEPLEKDGNMTYCSRTARKNLYNLGISRNNVAWKESAIASMNSYPDELNYSDNLSELPEGSNVLDLFIDTSSKYEHRAAAYLNNGEWFVLDPYAKKIPNNNNRSPIPMQKYLASYKLLGAFPKTSEIV